jgi:large subunit ribosomal protein L30
MGQSSDTIKVKLVKSGIGKPPKQRRVLKGLNLTRLNRTVTLKDTREIRGMIGRVAHLVEIVGE